jgi:hypothetical protein
MLRTACFLYMMGHWELLPLPQRVRLVQDVRIYEAVGRQHRDSTSHYRDDSMRIALGRVVYHNGTVADSGVCSTVDREPRSRSGAGEEGPIPLRRGHTEKCA